MKKILLVDDEDLILRSLAFYFEDEGYDVYTALTGEEALIVLQKENIDACVVDMRLPGIDGNEVIRRASTYGGGSKFIIHTGSTDYQLPDDIIAKGITPDQVFLKPMADLSVLVRAVQAVLEEKG